MKAAKNHTKKSKNYNLIYLLLLLLILTPITPTPDTYRHIFTVGTSNFAVIGASSIRLLDKDTNQINLISETIGLPVVDWANTYPLNYSLLIESDNSLTYIKWNGTLPYNILQNVVVSSKSTFRAVTCLEYSTLCYISTLDSHLIRFDIRSINEGITSNFTKITLQPGTYEKLTISDLNLKYLFASIYQDIYYLDPLTLLEHNKKKIQSPTLDIRKIHSFDSNPMMIAVEIKSKAKHYQISSVEKLKYLDVTIFKQSPEVNLRDSRVLRGTRYLVVGDESDNIYFSFQNYNQVAWDDEIQIVKTTLPKIRSLDFMRLDKDTFRMVIVGDDAQNEIEIKDLKFQDLNTIAEGSGYFKERKYLECMNTEQYSKNRCSGCGPGQIVAYSLKAGEPFQMECLDILGGLGRLEYEDPDDFKVIQECFEPRGLCSSCQADKFCDSCIGGLHLFDGNCLQTCPDNYSPDGNNRCQKCPLDCKTCSEDGLACLSCLVGENLLYKGRCFHECPILTSADSSREQCIDCTTGQYWNGGNCLDSCPSESEIALKGKVYPLNSTCNNFCLGNEYLDDLGNCKNCPENCSTCSKTSFNEINCESEPLLMRYADLDLKNMIYTISFELPISNKNIDKLKFSIFGEKIQILSIKKSSDYNIQALLKIEQQIIKNEPLTLEIEKGSSIFSSEESLSFNKFPVITKINRYSDQISKLFKASQPLILPVILLGSLFATATGVTSSFRLIRIMQSLRYLSLVNIKLPEVVISFTREMDITKSSVLRLFIDIHADDHLCGFPEKLREHDFSCTGFYNSFNEILILFFFLIFKFLLIVLENFLYLLNSLANTNKSDQNDDQNLGSVPKRGVKESPENTKSDPRILAILFRYQYTTFKKINQWIPIILIFPLVQTFSLKIMIGSWVIYYTILKRNSAQYLLSKVLLVTIYIFQLIIVLLTLIKAFKIVKKTKNAKKIDFLLIDKVMNMMYNTNKSSFTIYGIIDILQDCLMSCTLIVLQTYPSLQITILLVIFIFKFLLVCLLKPLKTKKENALTVINSFSLILIIFLFRISIIMATMFDIEQQNKYVGYPILALLLLTLLINYLIQFIAFITIVLSKLSKYCRGGKKIQDKKSKRISRKRIGTQNKLTNNYTKGFKTSTLNCLGGVRSGRLINKRGTIRFKQILGGIEDADIFRSETKIDWIKRNMRKGIPMDKKKISVKLCPKIRRGERQNSIILGKK